jgi:hypothetical protein
MCVAGGKRCEYSDAISNVRRKVRNRMKGQPSYEVQEVLDREVLKFREENPELVSNHLPARANFQCDPPEWEVPDSLLQLMGGKKDAISGVSETEKDEFCTTLYERRKQWEASLTEQEASSLHNYTQSGFESTNPFLRKKGYREWAKQKPHLIYRKAGDNADTYAEEVIKPRVADMDSAFTKVPATEPQKLYRYFEIPAGVSPEEYITKYFPAGGGHKDKGFVSTSADPEYVAAEIMSRAEKKKNTRFVVLEILSNSGGSLQSKPYRSHGSIQTLEAEVLLPRNTGMRILDSSKRSFVFGSDRADLEGHARHSFKKELDFSKGKKFSLPVIRMIDENLIREVRKTENSEA